MLPFDSSVRVLRERGRSLSSREVFYGDGVLELEAIESWDEWSIRGSAARSGNSGLDRVTGVMYWTWEVFIVLTSRL